VHKHIVEKIPAEDLFPTVRDPEKIKTLMLFLVFRYFSWLLPFNLATRKFELVPFCVCLDSLRALVPDEVPWLHEDPMSLPRMVQDVKWPGVVAHLLSHVDDGTDHLVLCVGGRKF
jgi:hypothetical protein